MSSIQIIECSKFNGKGTNSDWTNTFADPVRVNQGDVLQVKQIFIDTNSNVSDNIEIKEDTELELKFGYYVINSHHPAPSTKNYNNWGTANEVNFETYMARWRLDPDHDLWKPIIKSWKYTLKAGIYSASNLAETITKAMVELEFETVMPDSENAFKTKRDFLFSTYKDPTPPSDYHWYDFFKPSVKYGDFSSAPSWHYKPFYPPDPSVTPPVPGQPSYWMGSQIQTLLWNREGNNRFELVSHTPVIYAGHQVVNIRNVAAGTHYVMYNRKTGCYFTEMNPPSFWNMLGFSEDILVKFADNGYDLVDDKDLDKLGEKTTGGMISFTNCFIDPGPDPADDADVEASIASTWAGDNFTKTNGANYTLEATKSYDALATGGYYLVSCSNFMNRFAEPSQSRKNIQAIVSRQYDTNNFITAQINSGIDWQNKGESFLLSDIQIQILDPETKQPAEGLSDKSVVFLQLIKAEATQK